jgi:hypothetical protein
MPDEREFEMRPADPSIRQENIRPGAAFFDCCAFLGLIHFARA